LRRWRLTDPKLIIAGTVLGGALGGFVPAAGEILQPLGELYIAALSICIVPLIVTALVSGTGTMLRNPALRRTFPRFAIVYVTTLLVPCSVALAIGYLLAPGADLSADAVARLGQQIASAPSTSGAGGAQAQGLGGFLLAAIPSNIFQALSSRNFVAIVVFSILLGVGLGLIKAPAADDTIRIAGALFAAFSKIFEWILAPLALGLFCLMAGIAASVDIAMFLTLVGFIIAFYCAAIAVFAIYTTILLVFRRVDGVGALSELRRPLLISFLANNPIIALRPTIASLVEKLKAEGEVANTVLPFGIIASQHGQIINIILLTMFLANLYGISLSVEQILTLGIGGMIGGTAVVGGGATLAPVMAPILGSVGVPGDMAIVVLATTEQIIGPMISLLTVYAASTLVLLGHGGNTVPVEDQAEPAPEAEEKTGP